MTHHDRKLFVPAAPALVVGTDLDAAMRKFLRPGSGVDFGHGPSSARHPMGEAYRDCGDHSTRDQFMSFDAAWRTHDAQGNQLGVPLPFPVSTFDSAGSQITYDSTGAFLVGELERLDQDIHLPLASVSWARDIDLRDDVTIADEVSSFTQLTYGSPGGLGTGNGIGNGKAWIGKVTNQMPGVDVDIDKIPHPLRPWGMELKYTILELESAARLGRPVDQQKYEGLKLRHQMETDEQVYIGDLTFGDTGLVNSTPQGVYTSNVPTGASGSPLWTRKTPLEQMQDFNLGITSAWRRAAWAVMPNKVLLPTDQYGYVSSQLVSTAGSESVLAFIIKNNILTQSGQGQLQVLPCKWCNGSGVGGTIGAQGTVDRMVFYNQQKQYVRFPMTLLQRTPVQYDSVWHRTTYFCRLGVVEVVYPETLAYLDGL